MMKNKFAFVVFCVFLIFNASSVVAGDVYLNGNLGAVWLGDSDFSLSDTTVGKAEYDTGFGITGALGFDTGMFRFEGEVGYRKSDYDKIGASGQAMVDTSGDVTGWDFMANAYFDVETGSQLTPYIGGGLGVAVLETTGVSAGGNHLESGEDTVFAYQAIAGVAYSFTDAWMVQLEYRFFGTENPTFKEIESEYMSHNLFIGIRYNF
jgi:opacity protein-like surface antigen